MMGAGKIMARTGCMAVCLALESLLGLAGAEKPIEVQIRQELAKAKQEGMLTSVEDAQAYVPQVPDGQNAAHYYRQLLGLKTMKKLDPIYSRFSRGQNSTQLNELKSVVEEGQSYLQVVKRAANLERSWFDHDWAQGYGLTLPYYYKMKAGVKLLILEAQIKVIEGDDAKALDAVRAALRIANHASMDKTEISHLVCYNLKTMIIKQLIIWAAKSDTRCIWKEELKRVLDSFRVPSLREMTAFDLLNDMITLDGVKTRKGRAELGLEDNAGRGLLNSVLAATKDPGEGVVSTIRGRRKLWMLYGKEDGADQSAIDEAMREVYDGLISSFDAATVVQWHTQYRDSIVASRQQMLANKLILTQAHFLVVNPTMKSLEKIRRIESPEDNRPLRIEESPDGIWILAEGSTAESSRRKILVPIKLRQGS